jgi:hypothetical protein
MNSKSQREGSEMLVGGGNIGMKKAKEDFKNSSLIQKLIQCALQNNAKKNETELKKI